MKKRKPEVMPSAAPGGMVELLISPEFRVRVRRRVGPSMWGLVDFVLDAVIDAANVGLDRPDPWAPKEAAAKVPAVKKKPRKVTKRR